MHFKECFLGSGEYRLDIHIHKGWLRAGKFCLQFWIFSVLREIGEIWRSGKRKKKEKENSLILQFYSHTFGYAEICKTKAVVSNSPKNWVVVFVLDIFYLFNFPSVFCNKSFNEAIVEFWNILEASANLLKQVFHPAWLGSSCF